MLGAASESLILLAENPALPNSLGRAVLCAALESFILGADCLAVALMFSTSRKSGAD
jgi:hypothetical protein